MCLKKGADQPGNIESNKTSIPNINPQGSSVVISAVLYCGVPHVPAVNDRLTKNSPTSTIIR